LVGNRVTWKSLENNIKMDIIVIDIAAGRWVITAEDHSSVGLGISGFESYGSNTIESDCIQV
jgi:hypothetical protein